MIRQSYYKKSQKRKIIKTSNAHLINVNQRESKVTHGNKDVRLRVIIPLKYNEFILGVVRTFYSNYVRDNTKVSVSFLLGGQPFTVSDYDQTYQSIWILKSVQAAERDGCHGILIDVAFDTALIPAKHLLNIPVVGALQSMIGYTMTLAHRFSILAINKEEFPVDYRLAREYGFIDRLISVEAVNVGVLELNKDPERTYQCTKNAALIAIEKGADTLVLGCTGMINIAPRLQDDLGVPVLHGSIIGLYTLEDLVRLNLSHSKAWFHTPENKNELSDEDYQNVREITFDLN
jgi:allantoin racemase